MSAPTRWRERRLPFRVGLVDVLALAFAALVVVYALVPQSALGGAARGTAPSHSAFATTSSRSAHTSSGARCMLRRDDLRRLAWTLLAVAAFVAGLGLVDVYAVSIGWWRTNGVVDYFHRHLGYDYHGTGVRLDDHGAVYGLPENFIYNVGGDKPFLRRLVSTFLSPLASGYLFVVALLVAVAAMRRRAARARARGRDRSGPALDVLALVARRARRRARRARAGAPPSRRARRRGRGRRGRARLGAPLPEDRADGELDEGRPHVSAGDREGRPDGAVQRREQQRAVAALALGEPEGRRPHDDRPPAGLRPRQRRPDGVAHRDAAEGRGVELHGARGRARRARRRPLARVGPRAARRPRAGRPGRPVGGRPRRGVRGRARARRADRRDRRPVDRVLHLGPRRCA